MPTEVRHIIFKPAEVVEAVLAHRRAQKQSTPSGQVGEFGILERPAGASLAFGIQVLPDRGTAGAFSIVVEGVELVAVLLSVCRERKIPLPMRGSKALVAFGAQVGLVVTLAACRS